MQNRVTINDVAKAARVSNATVSRVLNKSDYPISPEIRKKVLEAAKKLHYTPNLFGRNLKKGKSNDIGVIVPSLLNPFYAETVAGIELECRKRGYNPIFCSSGHKVGKEMEYVDLLQQKCVDGLIISSISSNVADMQQILDHNRNIVLFDQPAICGDCDSVTYNFNEAGKMAAHYLIEKGHRDIAFLVPCFDRQSRVARFEGVKSGMKEAGLEFSESRLFLLDEEAQEITENESILQDNQSGWFKDGIELAQAFLKSQCEATAVVAVNDIIALGVIREFIRNGLKIPQDVSVMGFDDISISVMSNPALTTIAQPSVEMGRMAARMLIERINGEIQSNTTIVLNPSIVERESVRQII